MKMFSFDKSANSVILTPVKSMMKKLSEKSNSYDKSTSFDQIDFIKKLKEYDEKIVFYTKEKEKLKLIISAINKEPSPIKKTDSSDDKTNKRKDNIHELEEKLDIVVNKYNCLSMKYDIKYNDLENLKVSHKELRDKCYNYKNKYESLIKINNELKDKMIEIERNHLIQQEEFKSMIKKNSVLSKKVEELKSENQLVLNELNKKNKRLEIYRNNKSSNDINIQKKTKVYTYSEKEYKLLEEEFQRKISNLEKENQYYKNKLEEILKKEVTDKDATKGFILK